MTPAKKQELRRKLINDAATVGVDAAQFRLRLERWRKLHGF
jgi:hypothetical protein